MAGTVSSLYVLDVSSSGGRDCPFFQSALQCKDGAVTCWGVGLGCARVEVLLSWVKTLALGVSCRCGRRRREALFLFRPALRCCSVNMVASRCYRCLFFPAGRHHLHTWLCTSRQARPFMQPFQARWRGAAPPRPELDLRPAVRALTPLPHLCFDICLLSP